MSDIAKKIAPPSDYTDTAVVMVTAGTLRKGAAEIERLRTDERNLWLMVQARDAEIARLKAENEKLTKMVKDAYNEGFNQGMREHTTSRGGIPWHDSKFRATLTQQGGEKPKAVSADELLKRTEPGAERAINPTGTGRLG